VIEYKDSIIGIYKVDYMRGGNVGAVLKTDTREITELMEYYNSKCRK
jgi:hypothetical protein